MDNDTARPSGARIAPNPARSRASEPAKSPLPSIALPKGGGAIRSIGEKFSANALTGTASLSVPLSLSPSRTAWGPSLALTYDSGLGNGPFGFGWRLSLSSIARKTGKRLPRYREESGEEPDVFLLSDSEDLVPERDAAGKVVTRSRTMNGTAYTVRSYRPRIEVLFARIEEWRDNQTGRSHWRVTSSENVTSTYGFRQSANSRIGDPSDPDLRIFSWLLDTTFDDKGNIALYDYLAEDGVGVPVALFEQNRGVDAARYPKSVRYGNRAAYYADLTAAGLASPLPSDDDWMFQVVFDYGDHDHANPLVDVDRPWPVRPDPFSDYRSGFEVRTYRLCRRILMFHRFAELGAAPVLVRSTDLIFQQDLAPTDPHNPLYSVMRQVFQRSYVRSGAGYISRALPPLEMEFTEPVIDETVRFIDEASLDGLPGGKPAGYRWTDLYREGSPGILAEEDQSWIYKRNVSNFPRGGNVRAQFEPPVLVAEAPARPAIRAGAELIDFGDRRLRLVQFRGPVSGYYQQNDSGQWEPFTPFPSQPNVDWDDPDLRLIDLDGDGQSDVLLTRDDVFTWFPSGRTSGYGPPETVIRILDEERGPSLLTADPQCAIFLADMSGDGLTDIVRVRNGEVCYWPNLGYGRFGGKITMPGSPSADTPEQFDAHRVRLADLDGTGTSDLVYLASQEVRLYFNQSGNAWSQPHVLSQLPAPDNLSEVFVLDLLGTGAACLVWSSALPGDVNPQLSYVELMSGRKPHLLATVRNNLGAETRVRYVPSTRFYLQDYYAGRPWVTTLPFPVHVIERVEHYDRVSCSRFVSRFGYHHGYFDPEEREFRGFGMVEQWDTDSLGSIAASDHDSTASNLDASSYVPPVRTLTWFHTGTYSQQAALEQHYRDHEFYNLDAASITLADSLLASDLSADERPEACRALKGLMLRQEVYAEDESAKSRHPYTVSQQNYSVRRLQLRAANDPAVFLVEGRESLSYSYERNPADPRVSHSFVLRVGPFGKVLESAQIAYGRRSVVLLDPQDASHQQRALVTYTESSFTPSRDEDATWLQPLGSESRTFEVTGLPFTEATHPGLEALRAAIQAGGRIAFEAAPAAGVTLRPLSHSRTLYLKTDLSGPLPLGQSAPHGIAYESYSLSFTPGFLNGVFIAPGKLTAAALPAVLAGAGGYLASETYKALGLFPTADIDGHWWVPSGQTLMSPLAKVPAPPLPPNPLPQNLAFARQHFFLPQASRDSFGHIARMKYDANDLLVLEAEDALGNITSAVNDYRILGPSIVTDVNGNRSAVAFDVLGQVTGSAVMGKIGETKGDLVTGFIPDLTAAQLAGFVQNPLGTSAALLGPASSRVVYDVDRFVRSGLPVYSATIQRVMHLGDMPPFAVPGVLVTLQYLDGLGRVVQAKARAEDGDAPLRGPATAGDFDRPGALLLVGGKPVLGPSSPRWIGSGRTVFNNKGLAVRQYEPFFSSTHLFEDENEVAKTGFTPVVFYDPPGRQVAKLFPDHTYAKVLFDPWLETSYDVNDTVLEPDPGADSDVGAFFLRLPANAYRPTWHAARAGGALGLDELSTAVKTAAHAGTPARQHLDALGRPFLTDADNGPGGTLSARVELDITRKPTAAIDPLGRACMRYRYDMLGRSMHQVSIDSGDLWSLSDAVGRPLRGWDARGFQTRYEYDDLGRPVRFFVQPPAQAEALVKRTVYGERHPNALALNLRGRGYMLFDSAGLAITSAITAAGIEEAYDFKGNLLRNRRQARREYRKEADWSALEPLLAVAAPATLNPAAIAAAASPLLEVEVFTSNMSYDALNRSLSATTPDGSTLTPGYNVAGLLETVQVGLRGAAPTTFIAGIQFDYRRRRTQINLGNGAIRTFAFNPVTNRMTGLRTQAVAGTVQNLVLTYDAVGNLTHTHNAALQNIFFRNRLIPPDTGYTYDPMYRMIAAEGRELLGLAADVSRRPPRQTDSTDAFRMAIPHPGDGNAMGTYHEDFDYDAAGNLLQIKHHGSDPVAAGWTRTYEYEPNPVNPPAPLSNRLVRTLPAGPDEGGFTDYDYDLAGDMLRMPHLQVMAWDFRKQLQMTQRQAALGPAEKTYYVYDTSGERSRKVTDRPNGTRRKERIYHGGFEVYREYGPDGNTILLERQTLHVTDGASRVAIVETLTRNGGTAVAEPQPVVRYQIPNHLGSAALELDDMANIISYEEYYPYGSTSYQAGRPSDIGLKRYRFSSKERDEENGLNYHSKRYYAPWLGRWTSADPGGLVDGTNLYCYARCNPISASDPGGMQSTVCQIPARHEGDPPVGLICPPGESEDEGSIPKASTGPIKGRQRGTSAAAAPTAPPTPVPKKEAAAVDLPPPGRQAGPPPLPQLPPPEPDHSHGFYPMKQAEEQLAKGAVESVKEGKYLEALIGYGLREFMSPFATAEQLMPYNIPAHFLSAGQYAKRWIWYDMRGQSAKGLLELAKGHAEAASIVGSFELTYGATSSVARSGMLTVENTSTSGANRGFSVVNSGNSKVGVRNTENAYSFNTPVDQQTVATVVQRIETQNQGAAVYVGSGGHGGEFGAYFGKHPSMIEEDFLLEDLKTMSNTQNLGPARVLDLTKAEDLRIFMAAEKMALMPGQDYIFTIRAWCFSHRSKL